MKHLERGNKSEKYGLHKNKYVTGVETKNNGLNFYTEPGEYISKHLQMEKFQEYFT